MTSAGGDDRGFRAGLARGELLVPDCSRCDELIDYSFLVCPNCGSGEIGWRRASGKGTLRCAVEMSVSYSAERPAPYVIGSVKLVEGPHILARFEGDLESAYAGREVVAEFVERGLRFRPAD